MRDSAALPQAAYAGEHAVISVSNRMGIVFHVSVMMPGALGSNGPLPDSASGGGTWHSRYTIGACMVQYNM